jgi:transcription elongation factor Elf1
MKMDCPHCQQNAEVSFSGVSYISTSHGMSDYEWTETDGIATCSACEKNYEVRVIVNLDTEEIEGAALV